MPDKGKKRKMKEEVEILTIATEKRSGDRLSRISWLVERTSSVVLDSSLCVESRMKVTDDESLSLPRVDWITNELILCDPDPVNPWQSFVAVQRSGRG